MHQRRVQWRCVAVTVWWIRNYTEARVWRHTVSAKIKTNGGRSWWLNGQTGWQIRKLRKNGLHSSIYWICHITNRNRYGNHEIFIETTEFCFDFKFIFDMDQSARLWILAGRRHWHIYRVFISLFSLLANATRLFLQQTMYLSLDRQTRRFAVIIDNFVQCKFQLFHMHFAMIRDNGLSRAKDKERKKEWEKLQQ